jgi:hypothetical protein
MSVNIGYLYNNAATLSDWAKRNCPESDLIYKSDSFEQHKDMSAVGRLINPSEEPKVISLHTSKSVVLPVVAYHRNIMDVDFYALIRDNFYDLNVGISCSEGIDLPLFLVHREITKEYLLEQRRRMLDYSKPEKIPDEDDWSWYHTNWSGSKVIVDGGRYYLCEHCFAQGMDQFGLSEYVPGSTAFIFSSNHYTHAAYVIDQATRAVRNSLLAKKYPEKKD